MQRQDDRKRDDINSELISTLISEINLILNRYQARFSLFSSDPNNAALSLLREELQKKSNVQPFKRYVKLLDLLNDTIITLNHDAEYIKIELNKILIRELQAQFEAQWPKQATPDMHYEIDTIKHCLRKLTDATYFDSQDEQDFASMWEGVYDKREKYTQWLYLCDQIKERADQENYLTLVVDFIHRFGVAKVDYLNAEARASLHEENFFTPLFKQALDDIKSSRDASLIEEFKDKFTQAAEYQHDLSYLVRKIQSDHDRSIFSQKTHDILSKLSHQMDIWTSKNLIKLCKQYLSLETTKHTLTKIDPLINKLIKPIIEKAINPTLAILNRSELDDFTVDFDCKAFKNSFLNSMEHDDPAQSEETKQTQQKTELIRSILNTHPLLPSAPVTEKPEEGDSIIEDIISNTHLYNTIIAAENYLNYANGKTHGEHGRQATILFMTNLVNHPDWTLDQIQKEALRYIRGEDGYGTWYGGGSNEHRHSRISFLFDAGLFENKQDELAAMTPIRMGRFFQPTPTFADRDKEDRSDLTEKIKSLGQTL